LIGGRFFDRRGSWSGTPQLAGDLNANQRQQVVEALLATVLPHPPRNDRTGLFFALVFSGIAGALFDCVTVASARHPQENLAVLGLHDRLGLVPVVERIE
jgi:hypothetical protein